MEIGNIKVLIGSSVISLGALGFVGTQMMPHAPVRRSTPEKHPVTTAIPSVVPIASSDAKGAPPTPADPFGLPNLNPGGTTAAASSDLGFGNGTTAAVATLGQPGQVNATPAVAINGTAAQSASKPAQTDPLPPALPKAHFPRPNLDGITVTPVQPMGMGGSLPSVTAPVSTQATAEKPVKEGTSQPLSTDQALQTKEVSVTLRAIVRIDDDSVAYLFSDGQLRACRVGRSIGGNVKVKKITDEEVTLTRGDKTVTLTVGATEGL